MKKRILALLMLVCMVWGVFPAQASAAGVLWEIIREAELPEEMAVSEASFVVMGDDIYVIGGGKPANSSVNHKDLSGQVMIFNTRTNTWRNGPTIPLSEHAFTSAIVDGKIYSFSDDLNKVYVLEPGAGWYPAGGDSIKDYVGAASYAGVAYGRKIYLFSIGRFYIYDIETRTFEKQETVPAEVRLQCIAVEHDGKIYVFGGNSTVHTSLCIYDIATDTWSYGADVPAALTLPGVVAENGKIYVFGGINRILGESQKDIYIYDIATDTWMEGQPQMLNARARFEAALVNGQVYAIAGMSHTISSSSRKLTRITEVETISLQDINEASGITPTPDYKAYIKLNKNDTLEFDVDDADYTDFIWDSSNTSVAVINNGVITGVDEGTANIRITSNNGKFNLSIPIKVVDNGSNIIPVTNVDVTPSSITLEIDETYQLNHQVYPLDATNQQVSWTSDDVAVATVNANGRVTAVGEGTATITVTTADGGYTDTCFVTVEADEPQPPAEPENLALLATATASSQHNNNRRAAMANDGDESTSWMAAANDENAFLLLDFGQYVELNQVVLKEVGSRIGDYNIEIWDGSVWVEVHSGTRIGAEAVIDLDTTYTTTGIRINMFNKWNANVNAYALYEFEVYNR